MQYPPYDIAENSASSRGLLLSARDCRLEGFLVELSLLAFHFLIFDKVSEWFAAAWMAEFWDAGPWLQSGGSARELH